MEHEDPLKEREDPLKDAQLHEAELDARLLALFRNAEAPAPSSGFAARTMTAVKREPLPAGRRPLRSPLTTLFGWAALIFGVAVSAWLIAANQPLVAASFTTVVTGAIGLGVRLMQLAGAGLAVSDVFTTTGLAISRAVITKEGSTGLVFIAVIGALSLSALHRLLISEGAERGVSQWQEL